MIYQREMIMKTCKDDELDVEDLERMLKSFRRIPISEPELQSLLQRSADSRTSFDSPVSELPTFGDADVPRPAVLGMFVTNYLLGCLLLWMLFAFTQCLRAFSADHGHSGESLLYGALGFFSHFDLIDGRGPILLLGIVFGAGIPMVVTSGVLGTFLNMVNNVAQVFHAKLRGKALVAPSQLHVDTVKRCTEVCLLLMISILLPICLGSFFGVYALLGCLIGGLFVVNLIALLIDNAFPIVQITSALRRGIRVVALIKISDVILEYVEAVGSICNQNVIRVMFLSVICSMMWLVYVMPLKEQAVSYLLFSAMVALSLLIQNSRTLWPSLLNAKESSTRSGLPSLDNGPVDHARAH
jgi:hypothetical protein